jgi:hypothetical protein
VLRSWKKGKRVARLVQYPEENAEAALALATTVATTARVR